MKIGFCLAALGITFLSASAYGQSLADKKAMREADATLLEKVTYVNEKCGGAQFKATVDWASFKDKYKDSYQHGSASYFCDAVLDGLHSVCEVGPDEKAAVVEKVKAVKCTYGKPKTGTIGFKMNGTTLEATFDWDASNIGDNSKEWLMNNL